VSNALPSSMSNLKVPAAPASRPRSTWAVSMAGLVGGYPQTPGAAPANGSPETRPITSVPPAPTPAQRRLLTVAPQARLTPLPPPIPRGMPERMVLARERIRSSALAGLRIRCYEVALDLDLSEFHFARQFRLAFGQSPHAFYDEVRAERARALLREGFSDSEAARRVGFRRPAELRALLAKRAEPATL
jgi:AraC-like DNA-binding protein